MTRRASLGLAAGGVAAAAVTKARAAGKTKGAAKRGLNVLLITTDQEQPWRMYPSQLGLKNHERLMARSTHFENWTVNSVPCGPSRSVLYTGQHIQKTGIIDNPGVPPWTNSLDEGILTVGKLFKEAGYRTVYKGKWHLSVMKASPGTPPYGQGRRVALPPSFDLDRSKMLECHKVFQEDDDLFLGVIEDGDHRGWLNFVNYYADCLRDVDRHLGTVLDGLEAAGLADNTVVVFTADHGEMAAAHGQRQKGPFIYAENLGVPMMVSHPDAKGSRGTTTKALGSAVDLAPTLLGLAGLDSDAIIERHPELVGYDLAATVVNPNAPGRRDERAGGILLSYSAFYTGSPEIRRKRGALTFIEDPVQRAVAQTKPPYFVEYERRTFYRGVFDGRYRFARYFSPRDHHAPKDWANLAGRNDLELYDTVADPLEMTNLALDAEAHRELLLSLNAKLNVLTEREVGVDDGRHLPGPRFQWKTQ